MSQLTKSISDEHKVRRMKHGEVSGLLLPLYLVQIHTRVYIRSATGLASPKNDIQKEGERKEERKKGEGKGGDGA